MLMTDQEYISFLKALAGKHLRPAPKPPVAKDIKEELEQILLSPARGRSLLTAVERTKDSCAAFASNLSSFGWRKFVNKWTK